MRQLLDTVGGSVAFRNPLICTKVYASTIFTVLDQTGRKYSYNDREIKCSIVYEVHILHPVRDTDQQDWANLHHPGFVLEIVDCHSLPVKNGQHPIVN